MNKLNRSSSNKQSKKKGKCFGIIDTLKVAVLDIRGLNIKELELERRLKNKSINLVVISETMKNQKK